LEQVKLRRISEREYEFTIEGEDHTLGSLLQHYLQEDERVVNAYYSLVHPLERAIKVYVKLASDDDPVEVLSDALNKIIKEAKGLKKKLLAAYKEAGIQLED